jgi:glutathione S-transferase
VCSAGRAAEPGRRSGKATITFYKTADCRECQGIQAALEELCLAHEVVLVTASDEGRGALAEGTRPPVLVDEGKIYQGRGAILAHLEELEAFKELWYKYGSDSCYCDAQGDIE